MTKGIK